MGNTDDQALRSATPPSCWAARCKHIARSLDTIITTTVMPIAFMLLFVYVFGGAIEPGPSRT